MWLGVIPGLQLKHLQGGFSKAQICHISNHLFSYTYPLLTAIKLQAGPSSKRPSLSPQFTPQPLPFSGALWWQIKSSLRVVVIYLEQILSTAFDCWRAWSRLCVSFMCCRAQHVCVCVCVFAFPALPAIRGEREPALPRDQLPLTHGKISSFFFFFFFKPLLEGSNATNYLRGASQPSRRLDRWLWPRQTWGPSLGWHIRLPLKGERLTGGGVIWKMRGSRSDCILWSASPQAGKDR